MIFEITKNIKENNIVSSSVLEEYVSNCVLLRTSSLPRDAKWGSREWKKRERTEKSLCNKAEQLGMGGIEMDGAERECADVCVCWRERHRDSVSVCAPVLAFISRWNENSAILSIHRRMPYSIRSSHTQCRMACFLSDFASSSFGPSRCEHVERAAALAGPLTRCANFTDFDRQPTCSQTLAPTETDKERERKGARTLAYGT